MGTIKSSFLCLFIKNYLLSARTFCFFNCFYSSCSSLIYNPPLSNFFNPSTFSLNSLVTSSSSSNLTNWQEYLLGSWEYLIMGRSSLQLSVLILPDCGKQKYSVKIQETSFEACFLSFWTLLCNASQTCKGIL